ncbi:hypothetical protein [Caldimonas sp. KR1-144]|uniref:hypothetical protein n=1 Tax=Caldimonas sp. KR1-144 TaxID=3400911 RepID=UPI003C0550FF
MSRYAWPNVPGARAEAKDDPNARARHNARRYAGTSAEEALQALRAAAVPAPAPRRGGPLRAPATDDKLLWQPLGPAVMLSGQAEGAPRVSGRINALAVHPDGQRAYAASGNGGIWATVDGGATWQSVGGLAATDTAGITRPAHRNTSAALHVQWKDPAGSELVFMGTGEPWSGATGLPESSEMGVGIFVATAPLGGAADPWKREAKNLVNDAVYAMASSPDGATVVAAARTGLYQRPAGGGQDVDWPRVQSEPFKSSADLRCTDVLWTPPAVNGAPARLWVWVQAPAAKRGLWVRDDGQADFRPVAVDAANSAFGFHGKRGVLGAVEKKATRVWLMLDDSPQPRLFRVLNPKPADGEPKALAVEGVPDILGTQGWYDIALAVDPGDEDRVALAGSFFGDPQNAADLDLVTTADGATRSYDASIVVDKVVPKPGSPARLQYGTSARAAKMIGVGVHPDVHALAYSNGGATLWTGCDGGVYRSDKPLRPAGFYPRNDGLSISETNFMACDPRFEGEIVVGLQDNGVALRLSNATWRVVHAGDGGGVARNPRAPQRWVAQYTNGTWSNEATYGTSGPLYRVGAAAAAERDAAAFYSGAAAIAHRRNPAPAPAVNTSQLLIGTDRLWYSGDFGATWFTLPTGSDPLPANIPAVSPPVLDTAQDNLGAKVLLCRWQDADTAWALTENAVYRFRRTAGSHDAGEPGTWARDTVIAKTGTVAPDRPAPSGKRKKRPAVPAADPIETLRRAESWTEIEPNALPAAGAQPARGALYLGTTGNAVPPECDTLWWFDGNATWLATGLRAKGNKGQPWPAPVTSIAVDPARPDEVWVGTTVGLLKGTRKAVAGTPPFEWDWVPHVNGLPEAAVEDLALFNDGGVRLLRAAIGARGVWELRLDREAVAPLTYLRVHAGDLRHRDVARLDRGDGTQRSWHDSPDLRPRLAPSTTLAGPSASQSWWRGPVNVGAEPLRRFQAALRSSKKDPRVVANGLWDAYFSEVLRDLGAPTTNQPAPAPPAGAPALPAFSRVSISKAFFESIWKDAHRTAEPWGAGPVREPDLLELTPPLPEGDNGKARCELAARPWRVDVVVHHRGRLPRDGGDVRVTLLWWADPKPKKKAKFDKPADWPQGAVPWTATVQAMLNSADGASAALPPGWHYAADTDATRRQTLAGRTLDALTPQVATFEANVGALPKDAAVLLVAVIRAGADLALPAAADLQDLTRKSPAVAVRAVRIV